MLNIDIRKIAKGFAGEEENMASHAVALWEEAPSFLDFLVRFLSRKNEWKSIFKAVIICLKS